MKFVEISATATTVTIDGYSDKKTVLGAIRDIGRYIEKHLNSVEGNGIVNAGYEALLEGKNSCGGYFLEVEEVPCASMYDESGEMKYAEANFYVACRYVK